MYKCRYKYIDNILQMTYVLEFIIREPFKMIPKMNYNFQKYLYNSEESEIFAKPSKDCPSKEEGPLFTS